MTKKKKDFLSLKENIINLYLNEKELESMNIIHRALLRNGYTYIFQKINIKEKNK